MYTLAHMSRICDDNYTKEYKIYFSGTNYYSIKVRQSNNMFANNLEKPD